MRRPVSLEPRPWPFSDRPRALIEHPHPDEGLELAGALRDAGYAVALCRGPDGATRCPLHRLEPCSAVAGADVVVTALDFAREEPRAVLSGLRQRYPGTPLVVATAPATSLELVDLLDGCIVVSIAAPAEQVVRSAGEALESRSR